MVGISMHKGLRSWIIKTSYLLLLTGMLLGCGIGSCTKRQDIPPEDQLHTYITRAVNIVDAAQRKDLVDMSTGPLKSALVGASEETFRRAYIERKYDFRGFEIIGRKDVEDRKETLIDFKLIYKSYLPGEEPKLIPVTETTNRATLIYEHGRWAIAKVESLETNFEWENGLPVGKMTEEQMKNADTVKEVSSSRDDDESENPSPNAPAQPSTPP
jgi:hypothetical protein